MISSATIQFIAKETYNGAASLVFHGQAADNPATFTSATSNVSNRPRTSASVNWTPPAWTAGEETPNQRTPDLKNVIQEIVSRPGWASGNALVIVVSGSGRRTAWAFDNTPATSPLLHVDYLYTPPPDEPPVGAPDGGPSRHAAADGERRRLGLDRRGSPSDRELPVRFRRRLAAGDDERADRDRVAHLPGRRYLHRDADRHRHRRAPVHAGPGNRAGESAAR